MAPQFLHPRVVPAGLASPNDQYFAADNVDERGVPRHLIELHGCLTVTQAEVECGGQALLQAKADNLRTAYLQVMDQEIAKRGWKVGA